MRPTQGDFYKWLEEKGYDQLWANWDPHEWDPEGTKFSRYSEGFNFCIKNLNNEDISINELLAEFSPEYNLSIFYNECLNASIKFFEAGWRKASLSALGQVHENQLTEMIQFLKTWNRIVGVMTYFDSDGHQLNNVNLLDTPDHFPVIESQVYSPTKGWAYKMPALLQKEFGEQFWVKFENPKKIPTAKFAFVDGTFMAIPENLIPENCQKMLNLFQKSITEGGEKK